MFICTLSIINGCSAGDNKQDSIVVKKEILKPDSIITIQLSAVGDLMCHSTMYNYARVSTDSFNFIPCYQYIAPYLQSADFLIGNLETTFGGAQIPYSGYPRFNTPDDYLKGITYSGFDFLVTANNHSNDTDEKGILRTISQLDKNNISHTGTFVSQKDRDSIRIQNINGIKIGILSYTYSTNGIDITPGKPWLVNYIDSALIKKDITLARASGAELVLVFFHFGNEYERMPSEYQKNYVQWCKENGADIILGSHPHVLQPAQFFKTQNATLDTGFIAWSMGNFFSNQKDNFTDEGIIFNLYFQKNINTGKIKLLNANYIPTWVYRGVNSEKKLHVIFPVMEFEVFKTEPFITSNELQEMKQAQENTKKIISEMDSTIFQLKQ